MRYMTTTNRTMIERIADEVELSLTDPKFRAAVARQQQQRAIDANVEAIRQAAVRATHPDAAARVAERRAARAAERKS